MRREVGIPRSTSKLCRVPVAWSILAWQPSWGALGSPFAVGFVVTAIGRVTRYSEPALRICGWCSSCWCCSWSAQPATACDAIARLAAAHPVAISADRRICCWQPLDDGADVGNRRRGQASRGRRDVGTANCRVRHLRSIVGAIVRGLPLSGVAAAAVVGVGFLSGSWALSLVAAATLALLPACVALVPSVFRWTTQAPWARNLRKVGQPGTARGCAGGVTTVVACLASLSWLWRHAVDYIYDQLGAGRSSRRTDPSGYTERRGWRTSAGLWTSRAPMAVRQPAAVGLTRFDGDPRSGRVPRKDVHHGVHG